LRAWGAGGLGIHEPACALQVRTGVFQVHRRQRCAPMRCERSPLGAALLGAVEQQVALRDWLAVVGLILGGRGWKGGRSSKGALHQRAACKPQRAAQHAQRKWRGRALQLGTTQLTRTSES